VRRVTAPDIMASTASRPPGMCDVASADGLASLLVTVLAVSERPVTLLLEELAHIEIGFEMLSRTDRELTASEYRRLDAGPVTSAHHRAGLLRTSGGIVAAETGLVILPQRLPAGARAALAGTRIPLGEILARFGARRLERRALCRGGCPDSAGKDVAVESLAVLVIGDTKIGITTERITGTFCRIATERSLPTSRRPANPGKHAVGSRAETRPEDGRRLFLLPRVAGAAVSPPPASRDSFSSA
jgi:hypothetical protein